MKVVDLQKREWKLQCFCELNIQRREWVYQLNTEVGNLMKFTINDDKFERNNCTNTCVTV